MRMSRLFSTTWRKTAESIEIPSHDLLLRAGFIRQHAAGVFSLLPLAVRTARRIEEIVRSEMEAIGGQEVSMPVVNPAEIWKESGRFYRIDAEMSRFKDRAGRDMVLAMTHEEPAADLVRREIHSYKQLPALIYHIQTKWRDDPRPRGGLIRVREFVMKDSYSLDADQAGLDVQYEAHYHAYERIFTRCGIPAVAVEADSGMMGGSGSHEFIYLDPYGEDTVIRCPGCGYTANRQVAESGKPGPTNEEPLPVEKVSTPGTTTIDALAALMGTGPSRLAKAVFLMGSPADGAEDDPERFILAVIRGDLDANETKLARAAGVKAMRPASDAEIRERGIVPGYGSPIGMKRDGAVVIADDSVEKTPNLTAGANEEGFHLRNVNYGREFTADTVADIAAADAGHPCPRCGNPLEADRGIEVGNIFKLGTRYSESMGCSFLDAEGRERPVFMGSYGIGIGRLMACIAEEHHDERGLAWPMAVAPYHVYLADLCKTPARAEELYVKLAGSGTEVLFDDRRERAGVKFMDADLIGIPIRITVGERGLEKGCVELKRRTGDEIEMVPLDEVETRIRAMIAEG